MPELEFVVEKVVTKDGTNAKGPWTRYGIKVAEKDLWLSTFNSAQGKLAQEHAGTGAVLWASYEATEKGNNITELAGPVRNGDAPEKSEKAAFGDGSYVKGKENPTTIRSIAASVALREAVATMAHTVDREMLPKAASEKVLPLAEAYFLFLVGKAQAATDEDIPF